MLVNRLSKFLIFFFCFAAFYSCKKYVLNELTINPEIGIPLFHAQVSLSDIFKYESDSTLYMYADDNDLMHIRFEKTIDTLSAVNIFNEFYETDTIINDKISMEFVNSFHEITTTLDVKVPFDEDLDIYRIDSIRIDSCALMIELFTDPNNFDTLSIEIPTFYDHQGNHVLFEYSASDYNARKSVNMKGGIIYLYPSHFTSGLVNFKLFFQFTKKGETTVKKPEIRIYLYDLGIHSFYGKFVNYLLSRNDSDQFIQRNEFIKTDQINIEINEPSIYLFFKNGFNLPFSFRKLGIQAGNSFSKQSITGLPQSINVTAAYNGSIGYGQEMFLKNTNIETVLGNFPDSLYFNINALFNPGDQETSNSVTKYDSLFFGLKGDIPLDLNMSEIIYQRQLDSVKLENILKDFIEAVRFRAVIKNNFPVNISAQLFFVDEDGKKISDAFREPLEIKSSSGKEQKQYYETELSNEFEGEILDSLRKSKLIIEFRFSTADEQKNEMVQFLSTQNINFNFFVFGKTRIELL